MTASPHEPPVAWRPLLAGVSLALFGAGRCLNDERLIARTLDLARHAACEVEPRWDTFLLIRWRDNCWLNQAYSAYSFDFSFFARPASPPPTTSNEAPAPPPRMC